jgi:hypothetical protein
MQKEKNPERIRKRQECGEIQFTIEETRSSGDKSRSTRIRRQWFQKVAFLSLTECDALKMTRSALHMCPDTTVLLSTSEHLSKRARWKNTSHVCHQ